VKDNEVLRGIVARQNTELAQRSGEIYRFKRARLGLKIVYGVFAVGVLGVVAFAIKILPQILRP
jgi:cell division septal protein FtsQ